MDIIKAFTFESAHLLPNLPEGHKCKRLHGHSFRVEIRVRGELDPKLNWVMDFDEISQVVKPIIENELDHRYLNDVKGLENPTSEGIAVWLWKRIRKQLPLLHEIVVQETCTARAVYKGK
ncbi:MAG: 6-carboxytetrahydropterin synthase QueD [Planctomycetes bacterium]|nr:6-carboxytetrahydropterin synthase QueD [Planctomycetota bacterium]